MVEEFDLNKRTGIDLPHEVISTTPSREFKARNYPTDPEWKDIDTVYSSFGQGEMCSRRSLCCALIRPLR